MAIDYSMYPGQRGPDWDPRWGNPGDSPYDPRPKTAASATGFNLSPAPTVGQGAFGAVPGQIGLPSPSADLAAQYPNLAQANASISGNILSELRGVLSPETQAAIQDASARFGVTSGMPGSGLQRNRTARDLGLTALQLQRQGLQDYNAAIPTISRTQTVSPETQIGVAERNATMRAAPDPALAGLRSEELFNRYLSMMANRGNPAGGTGSYRPTIPETASTGGVPRPLGTASPAAGTDYNAQAQQTLNDYYDELGAPLGISAEDAAYLAGPPALNPMSEQDILDEYLNSYPEF